jgi:cation diffusion facilitator CzcD-associated flavoprotein CzcO
MTEPHHCAAKAPTQPWAQAGHQPRIAIIGAGISGIAAVVKLQRAGYSDLAVYVRRHRSGLRGATLATGFDPTAYILPTRVTGEDGVDLEQLWDGAPWAHRAVAVPGFPNFWMLEGPMGACGQFVADRHFRTSG